MKLAGTTKDGTEISGICKVLRHFGLKHFSGKLSISRVKKAIDKKHPVLIALQAYKSSELSYAKCWDDGHYVVAVGYNDTRIYFEDPSAFRRTWLSYEELKERWHDMNVDGSKLHNWGCIIRGQPHYGKYDAVHMD